MGILINNERCLQLYDLTKLVAGIFVRSNTQHADSPVRNFQNNIWKVFLSLREPDDKCRIFKKIHLWMGPVRYLFEQSLLMYFLPVPIVQANLSPDRPIRMEKVADYIVSFENKRNHGGK